MLEINNSKPILWTISGSDCSGGAGIAADIKTAHCLGVEACTFITANTVQNSKQLISINPVSVDILQQQVDALYRDKPPAVIKIGLLATSEQVIWLTETLIQLKKDMPTLIIVLDPVGQASVGGSLNHIPLTELTPLLQQIDVITPNLLEAHFLSNEYSKSQNQEYQHTQVDLLAQAIYQAFGINSIIIKAGHSDDKNSCIDYCYHQLNQIRQDNQEKSHQDIVYQLSSTRINNHYTHGGGCSFASAIASFLAKGYLVRDAFTYAKAFINQGLSATKQLSTTQEHSYYGAFEQSNPFTTSRSPMQLQSTKALDIFPTVIDEINQLYHQLPAFESLNLQGEKLGLYPVIDSIAWLKRLLPLGLHIIQLRVKNLPNEKLEQVLIEAINLAKNYKTRLFINDYWQLAIKHGAYGVHIGQEDLLDANLSQIQQAGLRLGISTHGCYEFLLAQQLQPSYLAIGAIFPTKTKDMTGQIQGIENLRQVLTLRPTVKAQQVPVVAIGGINQQKAQNVLATGVDSIAVVTAITEATNPEQAVEAFQTLVNG